jgi:hypothetical protein
VAEALGMFDRAPGLGIAGEDAGVRGETVHLARDLERALTRRPSIRSAGTVQRGKPAARTTGACRPGRMFQAWCSTPVCSSISRAATTGCECAIP